MLSGLLQACGGGGGGGPAPAPSNVTSLTIDPVNPTVAMGTNVQLHATAELPGNQTEDVTASATWVSEPPAEATVSNAAGSQGVASGRSVGTPTIKAKFRGRRVTTTFRVTNATLKSIAVTPVNPVIANGTTVQLAAHGTFSDGSVQDLTTQVTWSSGNSGIATVSTAPGTLGLATGASIGNTPITATFTQQPSGKAVAGSTTVTVSAATVSSITITPPVASIAKGKTLRESATCNLSDNTTQDCTSDVSWASSSGVATVSNTSPSKGLVTGEAVGTSTITGTFKGQQGSAAITVTSASLTSITVKPPASSIANGTVVQLTATGAFSDGSTQDLTTQVSWTSAESTIAQVTNVAGSQGLVTGRSVGSTVITATSLLSGVSGSATVAVTAATLTAIIVKPPAPSIAKGTTVPLTATCSLSDGTTQDCTSDAGWSSGDDTIAVVDNSAGKQGLVTGVAVGNAVVITAFINGQQGSATVTVTAATVTSIVVTPENPTIAKGTTVLLKADCDLSDQTTQDCTTEVGWTSNNEAAAQVSNVAGTVGVVKGLNVGTIAITATLSGISGSTTVTVTPPTLTSIQIEPAGPSIAKGTTVQLRAFGTFSDATTQELTTQMSWTSSAIATAPVGSSGNFTGLVTGAAVGAVTITATSPPILGTVSGTTTVTVTPATLTSITVAPTNPSIAAGLTVQLFATGFFSDGSTADLTDQVSWQSSAIGTAVVGSSGDFNGLVTGVVAGGPVTITATFDGTGISGSTTITVTPATLVSIAVTPLDPTIKQGATQQLLATGLFSDNTQQNITESASWTSSNPGIATVGTDGNQNGLVTGVALGTATITAAQEVSPGSSTTILRSTTVTVAPTEVAYVVNNPCSAVSCTTPGTVSAFAVNPSNGSLTPVGSQPTGLMPSGVAADPGGKFLYVANCGDNTVSAYTIASSGTLTPNGTVAAAGAGSPLLCTILDGNAFNYAMAVLPTGNFAYMTTGVGISGFAIDPSTGALTPAGSASVSGRLSALAANPTSQFIYAVGPTNSSTLGFSVDDTTGALTPLSTSFTPTGTMMVVSAAVDPLGNHLFNVNNGSSNVTNWTVDSSTGALTFIENVNQAAQSVTVDPNSEFVYLATTNPGLRAFSIQGANLVTGTFQFAPTGSFLRSIAVDPGNKFIYLANVATNGNLGSGNIQFSPITAPGMFPAPTVVPGTAGNPMAITVVAVP